MNYTENETLYPNGEENNVGFDKQSLEELRDIKERLDNMSNDISDVNQKVDGMENQVQTENLQATQGSIQSLSTNEISSQSASITELEAGNVNANTIASRGKVSGAELEISGKSKLKDDVTVEGVVDAESVKTENLEAGTLTADEMNVTNFGVAELDVSEKAIIKEEEVESSSVSTQTVSTQTVESQTVTGQDVVSQSVTNQEVANQEVENSVIEDAEIKALTSGGDTFNFNSDNAITVTEDSFICIKPEALSEIRLILKTAQNETILAVAVSVDVTANGVANLHVIYTNRGAATDIYFDNNKKLWIKLDTGIRGTLYFMQGGINKITPETDSVVNPPFDPEAEGVIHYAAETHGNIVITSKVIFNANVAVEGNALFNKNVDVAGNVHVEGNMDVDGNITIGGLVSERAQYLGNSDYVTADDNGNLEAKDGSFDGDITATGDMTADGDVNAVGDVAGTNIHATSNLSADSLNDATKYKYLYENYKDGNVLIHDGENVAACIFTKRPLSTNTVFVSTENELISALTDSSVSRIAIIADITINEDVTFNGSKQIYGIPKPNSGSKVTLRFKKLTGTSIIQFFDLTLANSSTSWSMECDFNSLYLDNCGMSGVKYKQIYSAVDSEISGRVGYSSNYLNPTSDYPMKVYLARNCTFSYLWITDEYFWELREVHECSFNEIIFRYAPSSVEVPTNVYLKISGYSTIDNCDFKFKVYQNGNVVNPIEYLVLADISSFFPDTYYSKYHVFEKCNFSFSLTDVANSRPPLCLFKFRNSSTVKNLGFAKDCNFSISGTRFYSYQQTVLAVFNFGINRDVSFENNIVNFNSNGCDACIFTTSEVQGTQVYSNWIGGIRNNKFIVPRSTGVGTEIVKMIAGSNFVIIGFTGNKIEYSAYNSFSCINGIKNNIIGLLNPDELVNDSENSIAVSTNNNAYNYNNYYSKG